jgi:hypothetical protein
MSLIARENLRWAPVLLPEPDPPLPGSREYQLRQQRQPLFCGSCSGGILAAVVGTLLLVTTPRKVPSDQGIRLRQSRRLRRLAAGQCPECGYDLTGNVSGVCPECGTPVQSKTAT